MRFALPSPQRTPGNSVITLVQVISHGMAEVANGGHVTVRITVGVGRSDVGRWTVLNLLHFRFEATHTVESS